MALELKLKTPAPKLENEFEQRVDVAAKEWLENYQQLRHGRETIDSRLTHLHSLSQQQKLQMDEAQKMRDSISLKPRDSLKALSVFGVKPFGFLKASASAQERDRLDKSIKEGNSLLRELGLQMKQEQHKYQMMTDHIREHVNKNSDPNIRKRALELARENAQQGKDKAEASSATWEAGRKKFGQTLLEQAQQLEETRKTLGAMRGLYGDQLPPGAGGMIEQVRSQLGQQVAALRSASNSLQAATRGMARNGQFKPPGGFQGMLDRSAGHAQRAYDVADNVHYLAAEQRLEGERREQQQRQDLAPSPSRPRSSNTHTLRP